MSSPLQNNITNLQELLAQVNSLPEAGGVELPELSNEGVADDLVSGKELIDSSGNVITGTMPNNGAISSTMDGINIKSVTVPAGYTSGGTVSLDDTIDNEVNEQADIIDQIFTAIDELPELADPEILVDSDGLITARVGDASSTHQLAFQPAKTITPSTASQVAVSSGYYTGGDILVASVPTQSKTITPTTSVQYVAPDTGKFLSRVTINAISTQSKTITPTTSAQTVVPDSGKFLSEVNIGAIPSTYVEPTLILGSATYTPKSTAFTIAKKGAYLAGDLTMEGDSDLIADNIRSGVSIFGVIGTLTEGISGSGDLVDYSENEDAIIGRTISSYTNDRITDIGYAAFASCSNLTSVNLPICTDVRDTAFATCSNLSKVNIPNCTSIYMSAFMYCTKLASVNFPACVIVSSYAFSRCYELVNAELPSCTKVGGYAFHYCSALTTVTLPACTSVGSSAFAYCSQLSGIDLPKCNTVGYCAFLNCTNLSTANLPLCSSIPNSTFANCKKLTTITLNKVSKIGLSAFSGCYNLSQIYIGASSVCGLQNSSVFASTPYIGYSVSFSGTPYIYVPASLVSSYKAASYWSYFKSYITAIET